MTGFNSPDIGIQTSPGITQTIPSFLYFEYSDDDDLQAFVNAYNALASDYLAWFNTIDLPVYPSPTIAGLLLDWVLTGLYGYPRPVLPSGLTHDLGPYGSPRVFGHAPPFGELLRVGPSIFYATSDDVYKRAATWHFEKQDGKYFTIKWLKRRVMRFLVGTNGTSPNIDQTYQIGVTFGPNQQGNITIYNLFRTNTGGAFGRRGPFGHAPVYGVAQTSVRNLTPFALAPTFKAAVDAGALSLPFQYQWVVHIIG